MEKKQAEQEKTKTKHKTHDKKKFHKNYMYQGTNFGILSYIWKSLGIRKPLKSILGGASTTSSIKTVWHLFKL